MDDISLETISTVIIGSRDREVPDQDVSDQIEYFFPNLTWKDAKRIDNSIFGERKVRFWRAAYEFPVEGDIFEIRGFFYLAVNCRFFTFDMVELCQTSLISGVSS